MLFGLQKRYTSAFYDLKQYLPDESANTKPIAYQKKDHFSLGLYMKNNGALAVDREEQSPPRVKVFSCLTGVCLEYFLLRFR